MEENGQQSLYINQTNLELARVNLVLQKTYHIYIIGSVFVIVLLVVDISADIPVDVDVFEGSLVGEADVEEWVRLRLAVARDARRRRLRPGSFGRRWSELANLTKMNSVSK